jgi:hypothetical protein
MAKPIAKLLSMLTPKRRWAQFSLGSLHLPCRRRFEQAARVARAELGRERAIGWYRVLLISFAFVYWPLRL